MSIKIVKISEYGYTEALLGLSLNHRQPIEKMPAALDKLAPYQAGHNKVLEFMVVYLDITAPRYFWQEFDTYRVGVSKSSESTMHNILDRDMELSDLAVSAVDAMPLVRHFNEIKRQIQHLPKTEQIRELKKHLPEGFLQRRIVAVNYRALRTILEQRRNHRLQEWKDFCAVVERSLDHPSFMRVPK